MRDDPEPLAYATPDADGLPDVMPLVEAAIDRGEPLRNLRKQIKNTEQMASYQRRSFARRFDDESAGAACANCGRPTEELVDVVWTGRLGGLANFRLSSDEAFELATTHALCERCLVRWVQSNDWPAGIRQASLVAWSIYMIATPAALYFRKRLADTFWWIIGIVLPAQLVLSAGAQLAFGIAQRRVPNPVRREMPRWVRFSHWADVRRKGAQIAGRESGDLSV